MFKVYCTKYYKVIFLCPSSLIVKNLTLVLRAGVVSQAKGSAYLETEKTKIICAVYPFEIFQDEEITGSMYIHRLHITADSFTIHGIY